MIHQNLQQYATLQLKVYNQHYQKFQKYRQHGVLYIEKRLTSDF